MQRHGRGWCRDTNRRGTALALMLGTGSRAMTLVGPPRLQVAVVRRPTHSSNRKPRPPVYLLRLHRWSRSRQSRRQPTIG